MNGVVTGGWNFVLAAYLVSGTLLCAYAIHTISQFRKSLANREALTSNRKGNTP